MNHSDCAGKGSPSKASILAWFSNRMEDTQFCVIFTFGLSAFIAFALSAAVLPIPRVHDEYSYLLAADALSQFKTSAPTHPHWHHFESFHVIHEPCYASKYPPGQALTLAVGQWLGHPIIGACFATAAALAGVMWMLIGWMPKRANMFVSLLLSTHPGIQLIWGQSYMGGAVAMLGGAMLLGALIRLTPKFELRYSLIGASGVSLLVITRPMEGSVLTVCVAIALLAKLIVDSSWELRLFLTRVVLPVSAVGTLAALGFFSYNASITGKMFKMPYQIHEETYGWNPLFLWQDPGEMPQYRHRIIERFYETDVKRTELEYGSLLAFAKRKGELFLNQEGFFFGCSLFFGIFGIPLALRQRRFWLAIGILVPVLAAGFVTPWGDSQYLAPIAPIILLLAFGGLLEIWDQRFHYPVIKKLVWLLAVMHCFWMVIDTSEIVSRQNETWQAHRKTIESRLQALPKKDLVFVRYNDETHCFHEEWVYNRLDIDQANVVWAREISPAEDMELIEYFGDRRVWIVQPDEDPNKLIAYQKNESTSTGQATP